MKKYAFFPVVSLAGGAAAYLLRLMQNRTGFEAETGLPVSGCLYAWLLPVLLVMLAAFFIFACRILPGERGITPRRFQDYFCTDVTLLPAILVAGAFLWLFSGAYSAYSGLTASRKDLLLGLLLILTAGCLFPAVSSCRRGSRKLLNSNLLLAPVVYLVIRLVITYRENSVDPSLGTYYIELLALVFLILSFYRASSFAFGGGRTRRFTVYSCMAEVLCLSTLADTHSLPDQLFLIGGILLVLGLLLLRLSAVVWAETPADSSET